MRKYFCLGNEPEPHQKFYLEPEGSQSRINTMRLRNTGLQNILSRSPNMYNDKKIMQV
jgi:hypothetical protein